MNNRIMIHTALIKINGVRERLKEELISLEELEGNVNKSQIDKLNSKIKNRKLDIKQLDEIELEFREEL